VYHSLIFKYDIKTYKKYVLPVLVNYITLYNIA